MDRCFDIENHSSTITVDSEVGSGGSFNINGHNNTMKLEDADCRKIVVMGHNNVIKGTERMEKVDKLVVIGHNNTIKQCHVHRLEILGHNNSFKYLQLNKQPMNNGFNNKISSTVILEDGNEDEITRDNSDYQQYVSDSSDSSSN